MLVVSTEGTDSSPLDWGNVSEACEIGGLGTLGSEAAGRPSGSLMLTDRRDDLIGR